MILAVKFSSSFSKRNITPSIKPLSESLKNEDFLSGSNIERRCLMNEFVSNFYFSCAFGVLINSKILVFWSSFNTP